MSEILQDQADRVGTPKPLDCIKVVDFGQYIAGPLLAGLLAEQGADVTHVDPPGGPRGVVDLSFLTRPARSVTMDLSVESDLIDARELINASDVVIENFRPGVMERLGLGSTELTRRNPGLIYCSLPGFGSGDERAACPGWEGVVMAAAAGYSTDLPTGLIPDERDPAFPIVFSSLPLGSIFAALEGAVAVAAALVARERDGLGQTIEVSLFDALAEAIGVRSCFYERSSPRYTDFGHGIFRCEDGQYVSLILSQFRHLEWLSDAFVPSLRQDGLVDYELLTSDPTKGQAVRQTLIELFAKAPASHWEKVGQDAGLPIGRVRTAREWLLEPQAAICMRPIVLKSDRPDSRVHVQVAEDKRGLEPSESSHPNLSSARDRPAPSAPSKATVEAANPKTPPLSGIRVLDMTRVVAGPTATRVLAQLGADVLAIDTDPNQRRSAISEPIWHEYLNRGKRSAIVDLTIHEDRRIFDTLIQQADVVVQNSMTSSLKSLHADPLSLCSAAPGICVVSLTTYGQEGPWGNYRGYAEIANVVTGISDRSMKADPVSGALPMVDRPRWTFTDSAAGLLGAFGAVIGVLHRIRNHRGSRTDVSLAGVAMLEQMGADTGDRRKSRGEALLGWSPWHHLYSCTDGSVFIGVPESAHQSVLEALDLKLSERQSKEINTILQSRFSGFSVSDATNLVRSAGGGAHAVMTLGQLCGRDKAFDKRGLWLEDDTLAYGRVCMLGPVVRFERTPMIAGDLPELFGSDAATFLER